MDAGNGTPSPTLEAFLARYWHDREHGRVGTLADYLRAFPGDEEAIAREYLALTRTGGPRSSPASADAFGPENGATVGNYRIVRELGRGGQAVVYLADDLRLPRQVALKVLTGSATLSDVSIRRFRREAEAASRLDHPGICTVFEHGRQDGAHFLAMRHVEGETLARRILSSRTARESATSPFLDFPPGPRTPGTDPEAATVPDPLDAATAVDVEATVALVEKAARALHAAHEAGIVHRDIKPANLMVTPAGEPVILDFGLACVQHDDSETVSRPGDLFGTPAYMSPEQIAAQRIDLDRRTDVWSLGVTLYEALTLRRPFETATREALYQAILTAEPESPRKLNGRISRDLAVVVATALRKNRDRRYQTALDFAEDLRRVKDRKPIRARRIGAAGRLLLFCRREPGLAASVAAAFLLLVAGLATTFHLLGRTREASADALRRAAEAEDARRRFQLLADERVLDQLEKWQDRLWPPGPAVLGEQGIDGWLLAADRIERKREEHEAALRELRARAEGLAPGAAEDERWLADRLEEIVRGIRALRERIVEMERRGEFALSLERRTIADHRGTWERIAAEVASGPHRLHGGVLLAPQLGLVPLGADPESGLQEFAVLQSGTPPIRDADSGRLILDASSSIVLVLLPGGHSVMGSPEGESGRFVNETRRLTEIPPFFLGKHEVTQAQWLRIMGRNPSVGHKGVKNVPVTLLHPVENVSWAEAGEFCRRLGLTLPREDAWEYAARAGSEAAYAGGADPACLEGCENIADRSLRDLLARPVVIPAPWDDAHPMHSPIGAFRPNRFGLHDMNGNVSEWCEEAYASDPVSGGSAHRRVLRGGNWQSGTERARCAARLGQAETSANTVTGVRPALRPGG